MSNIQQASLFEDLPRQTRTRYRQAITLEFPHCPPPFCDVYKLTQHRTGQISIAHAHVTRSKLRLRLLFFSNGTSRTAVKELSMSVRSLMPPTAAKWPGMTFRLDFWILLVRPDLDYRTRFTQHQHLFGELTGIAQCRSCSKTWKLPVSLRMIKTHKKFTKFHGIHVALPEVRSILTPSELLRLCILLSSSRGDRNDRSRINAPALRREPSFPNNGNNQTNTHRHIVQRLQPEGAQTNNHAEGN